MQHCSVVRSAGSNFCATYNFLCNFFGFRFVMFSQVMKKELTRNLIYNFFDGAKEANLYKIKSPRLHSQKVVIGFDIDDIGNLEDLLRIVFIDEECGNLKAVMESLLETLTKRRSQTFYRHIDLHSATNAVDEDISSISKWNIVKQLSKFERKETFFSDQMNRNCLDLSLLRTIGTVARWRI